jgi:hypothetical protein
VSVLRENAGSSADSGGGAGRRPYVVTDKQANMTEKPSRDQRANWD